MNILGRSSPFFVSVVPGFNREVKLCVDSWTHDTTAYQISAQFELSGRHS